MYRHRKYGHTVDISVQTEEVETHCGLCADRQSGDDHFSVSTNITTNVTRYFLKLTRTNDTQTFLIKYLYKIFIYLNKPHLQSIKMEF